MKHNKKLTVVAFAAMFVAGHAGAAGTLDGWALMPADTFAPGPTSGQFTTPQNGVTPPYIDKQPVQGFSAVLNGPTAGSFYVMPDNGFGTKANSADALLRMYALRPDFKTATGGSGTVSAADYQTGAARSSFDNSTFINLRDPDSKLGFPIVASQTNYPNGSNNIPVDPSIKSGRLLTGADLDIESVRKDKNGNLWFGEEFGPFLVKTDATGKVLRSEISLPGVKSPSSPYLGNGETPNLNNSNGRRQALRAARRHGCRRRGQEPAHQRVQRRQRKLHRQDLPLRTRRTRHQHRRHDGHQRPRVPRDRTRRFVGRRQRLQEDLQDRHLADRCQRLCRKDRDRRPDEHLRSLGPQRRRQLEVQLPVRHDRGRAHPR
jgi:hypothetical protein